MNRNYLIQHAFYPTLREVERIVMERFGNCSFAQNEYLRHGTGRTRSMKVLLGRLPGGPWLFAQLKVRALYFHQQDAEKVGSLLGQERIVPTHLAT